MSEILATTRPQGDAFVVPVVGAATDVGRLRTVNEDGYLAMAPAFVVVDGMGGHAAGRAATRAALSALAPLAGADITGEQDIVEAVLAAGEAVAAIPSHAAHRPGATVAGAVLARRPESLTWIIFNIGDSRVYLLRDAVLTQMSRDHSQVQALIDAGQLTPAQARRDPRKNVVTRALGAGLDQEAVPDIRTVAAQCGDRLLICSDGLSDELDDEALATVLDAGMRPQHTAEAAVAAALEAGGHDNTTALVVDLVPESAL